MLKKVKIKLKPIVNKINLPTVIRTAILPGESVETLFIATQIGEILYIKNGNLRTFLDIRKRIIKLEGNEERGLMGLAFHPEFKYNGLFYLHYSVADSQGKGAILKPYPPNPCDDKSLNLKWIDRENNYNHIDTVEEWTLDSNQQIRKMRTLLNIRRPFSNHNGFNSLNFSPETGKLILTTGDGGKGYDPFNLSQNNMEIAGKIIEIDITKNRYIDNKVIVTRFDELPLNITENLSIIAKGVRNISGVTFQRFNNGYIKYIGNVGQSLVESVFSFVNYIPIPVKDLVENYSAIDKKFPEGFINFGWRAWEGVFPTLTTEKCENNSSLNKKNTVYYDEAIELLKYRIGPLTCSFHEEVRPDKFRATAITGVRPYMGKEIPDLTGNIVFSDLARRTGNKMPARGVLAYTKPRISNKLNDYSVIEIDHDFGSENAYFVGLGANTDQSRLYLAVSGSTKVTEFNKGTIYEVIK